MPRVLHPPLTTATGVAVGLSGLALVGVGAWGRREAGRALAREHISSTSNRSSDSVVANAKAARSLAELIRRNTLSATGGRTYAETDPYVDSEGKPTPDESAAAQDVRTGQAVESPGHALWIQSTTLQTALMQAYLAFRLSELTVALGTSFVAVGVGLAAAGNRLRD
jgi:hypothetical protein